MCEVPFVSCRLLRQGSSFNCAFVPNHFRAQLTAALLLHRNFLVTQRVSCRTLCNAQTPRARSPGDMPARHSTSGCCWNNTRPVVKGWTPLRPSSLIGSRGVLRHRPSDSSQVFTTLSSGNRSAVQTFLRGRRGMKVPHSVPSISTLALYVRAI